MVSLPVSIQIPILDRIVVIMLHCESLLHWGCQEELLAPITEWIKEGGTHEKEDKEKKKT